MLNKIFPFLVTSFHISPQLGVKASPLFQVHRPATWFHVCTTSTRGLTWGGTGGDETETPKLPRVGPCRHFAFLYVLT